MPDETEYGAALSPLLDIDFKFESVCIYFLSMSPKKILTFSDGLEKLRRYVLLIVCSCAKTKTKTKPRMKVFVRSRTNQALIIRLLVRSSEVCFRTNKNKRNL